MPLNVSTSNYINTQTSATGGGQNVGGNISVSTDGAVISVKGLDIQAGQTISGQVMEVDGKDIKLLLSNNQTINARIEGNINAVLGQTLSFEVKATENGQTALRPLYTNLNNSQTVTNALKSAGLPVTEDYTKMVSSMMDEGLPIHKNALYDMARTVNSFPNANPDTIVKLNKLGLQINELTINQYENYEGLKHQISGDVDKLSNGLTDLMKDSLSEVLDQLKEDSVLDDAQNASVAPKPEGRNLFSSFLNAITGNENKTPDVINESLEAVESSDSLETGDLLNDNAATLKENTIDASVFDTSKQILDLVDIENSEVESEVSDENISNAAQKENLVSSDLNTLAKDFAKHLLDNNVAEPNTEEPTNDLPESLGRLKAFPEIINNKTPDNTFAKLLDTIGNKENMSANDVLSFAKNVLSEVQKNPEKFSNETKQKLAQLLSDKDFGTILKNSISKQMLLKPEDVVNAKNVEDLYSKITKQATQAMEILQNSGKDNPELLNAAKNINDNVSFMNELNHVVTYVQLPLLMNNKSAHGDLYVYTNKKSLKNNDGNISALLHLDMENLGPMDIYVALTNGTKLNTHFYLKDDATIDFIEAHIDYLNKRLADKGYDMSMNISVKDMAKGPTNMSKEFMKDDPGQEGMSVSKFSFDVRA